MSSTDNGDEIFEIFDEDENKVGELPRAVVHREGQLHRSVNVVLLDSPGSTRVLVQRRWVGGLESLCDALRWLSISWRIDCEYSAAQPNTILFFFFFFFFFFFWTPTARSDGKKVCPGLWDVSVAEHCQPGETYEDAALRGMEEELGLEKGAIVSIECAALSPCAGVVGLHLLCFDFLMIPCPSRR